MQLPPRTALETESRGEEPLALPAPVPEASTDRVAAYLIEQYGKKRAEETARANAAWYGAGRAEHRYWESVAAAIARRPES